MLADELSAKLVATSLSATFAAFFLDLTPALDVDADAEELCNSTLLLSIANGCCSCCLTLDIALSSTSLFVK